MKKIWIVIGVILLAAAVAAGGFWGGMIYQANQASQAQANFANARGQGTLGQIPNGGAGFPTGGASGGQIPGSFGGGGTIGTVKTIDGNVITISTAQNVTTVNLSESTQIQKSTTGAVADLQPGMQVTVIGQTDSNGNINANRITILDASSNPLAAPSQPYPTPTGTEP